MDTQVSNLLAHQRYFLHIALSAEETTGLFISTESASHRGERKEEEKGKRERERHLDRHHNTTHRARARFNNLQIKHTIQFQKLL